MNFVQVITLPSPRRPPLVLCAGDEGTPSPHQLAKEQPLTGKPLPGEKCRYQERHFTVTLTPPQTTLKHNYI